MINKLGGLLDKIGALAGNETERGHGNQEETQTGADGARTAGSSHSKVAGRAPIIVACSI